jgi:hypothetical protein
LLVNQGFVDYIYSDDFKEKFDQNYYAIIEELKDHVNDAQSLLEDEEYININNHIQGLIQEELMKSVRWKINSNPDAVQKIERLKVIIKNASKEKEAEEKRSLAELNDYIKNYSSLTFDEYRRLKGEV